MNGETNLAKIISNMKHNCQKKQANVVCAGGIIYDVSTRKILVVQGRVKWSLPKGHREPGEEPHETAMREIYEETSMRVILNEQSRSKRILKSLYYLITVHNADVTQLFPIDTNEVICVKWCDKEELYSLDCNKQLKYLLKKWDYIINQLDQGVKSRSECGQLRHL